MVPVVNRAAVVTVVGEIDRAMQYLADLSVITVVQMEPAVHVALAEVFEATPGEIFKVKFWLGLKNSMLISFAIPYGRPTLSS